jgi:hypothetical protein
MDMSTFAERWIAGVAVAVVALVLAATAWHVVGGVLIFAGVLTTPSSALTARHVNRPYQRRRAARSAR